MTSFALRKIEKHPPPTIAAAQKRTAAAQKTELPKSWGGGCSPPCPPPHTPMGGHRDNPDSVQFKAAFTETTIDSIFLRSKQANCEEGMDSFLMTLIEADTHDPLFQIPTPPVIPPLILELKALNQPHQSLDLIEENIVVYIAGYIAKRIQKLVCNACFSRLTEPMEDCTFQFIMQTQYSDT